MVRELESHQDAPGAAASDVLLPNDDMLLSYRQSRVEAEALSGGYREVSPVPGTAHGHLPALARLLDAGATPREAVRDVGGSIRVATVLEPAGTVLGIIENPHVALPDPAPTGVGPGR